MSICGSSSLPVLSQLKSTLLLRASAMTFTALRAFSPSVESSTTYKWTLLAFRLIEIFSRKRLKFLTCLCSEQCWDEVVCGCWLSPKKGQGLVVRIYGCQTLALVQMFNMLNGVYTQSSAMPRILLLLRCLPMTLSCSRICGPCTGASCSRDWKLPMI
jgi:hypothetical protein